MEHTKKLGCEELRSLGILHEVNRLFFHPLGLALAVIIPNETATPEEIEADNTFGTLYIVDGRDDLEGWIFHQDTISQELIDKFEAFQRWRHTERLNRLGFIIQDEPNSEKQVNESFNL